VAGCNVVELRYSNEAKKLIAMQSSFRKFFQSAKLVILSYNSHKKIVRSVETHFSPADD